MRAATRADFTADLMLTVRELRTRRVAPRTIRAQVEAALRAGPFVDEDLTTPATSDAA